MPIHDIGSIFINNVVFITHLFTFHVLISHAEVSTIIGLYLFCKVFGRRPEDILDVDGVSWPPSQQVFAGPRLGAYSLGTSRMTSSPGGRRSPAANGNGYESPTEEVQNVLFSSQPSAATTPIRPSLVSRASHMVAMHPTGHTGRTNSSGLNDILAQTEKQVPNGKVSIKDRIACHQWTYFTMTMATGGMANVLYSLNWSSVWIIGVGKFFFILNLVLFLINCVLISIRFYLRPGSLTHSFTDQVESLFIPSFVVSIAIIMINTCQYGVPSCGVWLLRTMEIMFWIYVGLSVLTSAGIYLILWSTLVFPVHTMTPTWVFPAYPLLLTAPFASNLIGAAQKTSFSLSINSTAVAFCAVTTQGTGTLIAFMISAAFIYRLMTQKLPRDPQRPGVFMSIGPFGFTASSIAQLGQQASMYIPDDFLGMPHTVAIIQVVSLLVSLWLWGLAFWFFIVSVGSLWKYVRVGSHLPFQMTWWSFVFPNTALVTATGVIGGIFKSKGLDIFASVMTAFLVIVWAYVFITMLRGLKRRKLMWPKNNS